MIVSALIVQILALGAFGVFLYKEIAERSLDEARESLEALATFYADASGYGFITAVEQERLDLLEGPLANPNIEAAFLATPDGRVLAAAPNGSNVDRFVSTSDWKAASASIELDDYWIIIRPVFNGGGPAAEAFRSFDESANPSDPTVLGVFGVVGSKRRVNDLLAEIFWVFAALSAVGTVVLLALTSALANYFLKPVDGMIRDIAAIDGDNRSQPLRERGSIETRKMARAVNRLLGEVHVKRADLERRIQEKTAEEQRQREAAEAAQDLAERALNARSTIMSVHTHEMLTPIRIMINELELLRRDLTRSASGRLVPAIDARLKKTAAQVRKIEDVVDQINLIHRIEKDDLRVNPDCTPLGAIVAPLRGIYGEEARRRDNTLCYHFDEDVSVRTDRWMIEVIARNLLSNACKFTKEGRIDLSLSVEGGQLNLICTDTGVGISEDKLGVIFEPLKQEDMSARRIADGMGLGLSIVKGFVEKLDGEVSVESKKGTGTTFTVSVPVTSATCSPAGSSG
ncbi:MAG: ATP-binding protein [Pseudomonadota bacterium]